MTATAPGRLHRMPRRLGQLTERSVSEFFSDRCPQLAAAISYYALFALFPVVILAVGVFGAVVGQQEAQQRIVELLTDSVPVIDNSRSDLERAVGGVAGHVGAFSVIGVAGLVFSASGLMGAVRNAVNTAWEVTNRRPPLVGKLLDILLVAAIGPFIAASFAITLVDRFAPSWMVGGASLARVAPIALAALMFGFLYRVLPATEVRWRDIWPGALVAAGGYELAKTGFAVYISNFGSYSDVYGSVAAVVIFLFFVFIASNVFLLGAEIASEWPKVRAGHYDDGTDQGVGEQLRKLLRSLVIREDPKS